MANLLITGANQGIGYFLARQALLDGHRVSVLDLETNHLQDLAREFPGRLLYFRADVCDIRQVHAAVEDTIAAFRRVDIAIHNACLCTFGKEENADYAACEHVFQVNYYGALRLVKSILPYMRAEKTGKIIFASSGVAVTGFPGIYPYASSKGALEALAKCLNLEYASDDITFHIFHPPLTRTRSSSSLPVPKEFMADPQKVGQGLARRLFSKRFIICHSTGQKLQMIACYLFPIKMGQWMAKMTARCSKPPGKSSGQ